MRRIVAISRAPRHHRHDAIRHFGAATSFHSEPGLPRSCPPLKVDTTTVPSCIASIDEIS
jgi:hypothetical protein